MNELIVEIISRIESEVCELKEKIQPGAVDAEISVPYAVCTIPENRPIRTMHGIAGYETTFELSIFHTRKADVDKLRNRVIAALERYEIGGKRIYLKNGSDGFYDEFNVHGYTLTFKII